jgi:glucose/arabinose dehydrogenase
MRPRAIFIIVSAFLYCASVVAAQENPAPPSQPAQAGAPASQTPATPATPPDRGTQQDSTPPAQGTPIPSAADSVKSQQPQPASKRPVLRRKKRTVHKKTTLATKDDPGKIVVKNGGAKDSTLQLSPAITADEAQRQRANTTALLAMADANLKRVAGRQLSASQESTLEEIRTYMQQAKAASTAGDVGRAQTLAYKARLLSDELARK